jgi:nucleoside-diphosphate-sugar epimerase
MQRILVTGGLGKLGRPLLMALRHRGFQIRAMHLPQEILPSDLPEDIEFIGANLAEPDTLKHVVAGMDVVLHAAAILQSHDKSQFDRVNHLGTRYLLDECLKEGVKHFVLVSSISVTYPVLSPYALSKRNAELALMASPLRMKTIVRPTLIYDDHGGGAEFAALVRFLVRFPIVILPQGGVAKKRPVHADDAAQCLAQIPLAVQSAGKTYSLAGGEILCLHTMVERIAMELHLKRPIWGLPISLAQFGVIILQALIPGSHFSFQGLFGLIQDAAPEIHDLQVDFGYAPRPFQPRMRASHKASCQ